MKLSTAENNACLHITSLEEAFNNELFVAELIIVNYGEKSL